MKAAASVMKARRRDAAGTTTSDLRGEADAVLETGRLTDAAEVKLAVAFQARGVVPLRPSEAELRLEYAAPRPGGGARIFCCDLALRVRPGGRAPRTSSSWATTARP